MTKVRFNMTFDDFWSMYDKKTGRKRCLTAWMRLTKEQKKLIQETLPAYVASTPEAIYRKHPITYLHGECWNDELIKPKENDKFSENSVRDRLSQW